MSGNQQRRLPLTNIVGNIHKRQVRPRNLVYSQTSPHKIGHLSYQASKDQHASAAISEQQNPVGLTTTMRKASSISGTQLPLLDGENHEHSNAPATELKLHGEKVKVLSSRGSKVFIYRATPTVEQQQVEPTNENPFMDDQDNANPIPAGIQKAPVTGSNIPIPDHQTVVPPIIVQQLPQKILQPGQFKGNPMPASHRLGQGPAGQVNARLMPAKAQKAPVNGSNIATPGHQTVVPLKFCLQQPQRKVQPGQFKGNPMPAGAQKAPVTGSNIPVPDHQTVVPPIIVQQLPQKILQPGQSKENPMPASHRLGQGPAGQFNAKLMPAKAQKVPANPKQIQILSHQIIDPPVLVQLPSTSRQPSTGQASVSSKRTSIRSHQTVDPSESELANTSSSSPNGAIEASIYAAEESPTSAEMDYDLHLSTIGDNSLNNLSLDYDAIASEDEEKIEQNESEIPDRNEKRQRLQMDQHAEEEKQFKKLRHGSNIPVKKAKKRQERVLYEPGTEPKMFSIQFDVYVKKYTSGKIDIKSAADMIVKGNTPSDIIEGIWTVCSKYMCRKALFKTDEKGNVIVSLESKCPQQSEFDNFIGISEKVSRKKHTSQSIMQDPLSLRHMKGKEIQVHVYKYSSTVSSAHMFSLLKNKVLDPAETDRAGAIQHKLLVDIVDQLKSMYGQTYSAPNLTWHTWAITLSKLPQPLRDETMRQGIPEERLGAFNLHPLKSEEMMSNAVKMATNINNGHLEDIQILKRDAEVTADCFKALMARIESMHINCSRQATLLDDTAEVVVVKDSHVAESMLEGMTEQEDVDHIP